MSDQNTALVPKESALENPIVAMLLSIIALKYDTYEDEKGAVVVDDNGIAKKKIQFSFTELMRTAITAAAAIGIYILIRYLINKKKQKKIDNVDSTDLSVEDTNSVDL